MAKNWTSDKPFSFLIRRNGAYLRQENKPLHLVDECPRRFLLAYIVNRNFPYKHEVSVFLQRCMGAGLMAKVITLLFRSRYWSLVCRVCCERTKPLAGAVAEVDVRGSA